MEKTFEAIATQYFFFEYLINSGNFTTFIRLSLLNKILNDATLTYKNNSIIWKKFCERDFKMWIPEDDDEWSLHFLKLKPGEYFGIYCYFWGVLNQQHIVTEMGCDFPVPMYFALKAYKKEISDTMIHVRQSTRKIAFLKRQLKDKNTRAFYLKDCFNRDRDKIWSSFNLFSYVICSNDACKSDEFTSTMCHLKFMEVLHQDHFRDEYECSAFDSLLKWNNGKIEGTAKLHCLYDDGRRPDYIHEEKYECLSACFLKNKVFSMA